MWIYRNRQKRRANSDAGANVGGLDSLEAKPDGAWDRLDRILRRALPAVLVLGTLFGVSWLVRAIWFTPPMYEAEALIRIEDDDLPSGTLDRRIEHKKLRLLSPLVLLRMLGDPDINRLTDDAGGPIDFAYLRREVQVDSMERSDWFRIRIRRTDPREAADIVNAVLDAYVKLKGDREAGGEWIAVEFWDWKCDQAIKDLELRRQSVRAAREAASHSAKAGAEPTAETAALMLAWLHEHREAVLERRSAFEAQRTTLQRHDADDESAYDARIREILARHLAAMEREVAQVQNDQAAASTAEKRNLLAERIAWIRADHEAHLRPLLMQWRQLRIGVCTEEIELLDQRVARLDAQIESYQDDVVLTAPLAELQLAIQRAELEDIETRLRTLLDYAESLKVEMRSPERVGPMRRAAA